jgi:hypothetical protein
MGHTLIRIGSSGGLGPTRPFVLGDQFPDRWDRLSRYFHDGLSGILICCLVLRGIWNVYFGPLKLGRLLERHMRIEDAFGRLKRKNM